MEMDHARHGGSEMYAQAEAEVDVTGIVKDQKHS